MALKVVEIHLAEDRCDDATEALKDLSLDHWRQPGGRFDCIVSCVVASEHTGTALDRLHERLTNRSEFLVLVRPLDDALPRRSTVMRSRPADIRVTRGRASVPSAAPLALPLPRTPR